MLINVHSFEGIANFVFYVALYFLFIDSCLFTV
jgi:hypothetical protein